MSTWPKIFLKSTKKVITNTNDNNDIIIITNLNVSLKFVGKYLRVRYASVSLIKIIPESQHVNIFMLTNIAKTRIVFDLSLDF